MNPYITNDLALLEPIQELMGGGLFMRRTLLASMVAGRRSLRFLLAPDGYGKTSLALSYAKLAFGLKSFWWVDSQDPRFLLDLDSCADKRSNELYEFVSSHAPSLLVFDDVPVLTHERERAFMDLLADASFRGWEVVVTSTNLLMADASRGIAAHAADPDACETRPRVKAQCLYARDLLLCETELKQLMGAKGMASFAPGTAACIPALVFGGGARRASFLNDLAEHIDGRAAALALASAILQPEYLADLDSFYEGKAMSAELYFARDAPHAGFASAKESCFPLPLTVDERFLLFKRAQPILGRLLFEESECPQLMLAKLLQESLVAKGELSLAARIVAFSGNEELIGSFALEHEAELLERANFLALAELGRASAKCSSSFEMSLMLACAFLGLGDSAAALEELDSLTAYSLDPSQKALLSLARALMFAHDEAGAKEAVKAHIKTLGHLIGAQPAEPRSLTGMLALASVESTRKGSAMATSLRRRTGKGATSESVLAAAWMVLLVMHQRRGFKVSKQLADSFAQVSSSLALRGEPGILECVLDACARQTFGGEAGKVCGRALFVRSGKVKERIAQESKRWAAGSRRMGFGSFGAGLSKIFPTASASLPGGLQLGALPSDELQQDKETGVFRLFGGFELRLPNAEVSLQAQDESVLSLDAENAGKGIFSQVGENTDGNDGAGEGSPLEEQAEGEVHGGVEGASMTAPSDSELEGAVVVDFAHAAKAVKRQDPSGTSFVAAEGGGLPGELSEPIHLRAKAQLLMSLLALNHDKEISRESLCASLWPAAGDHSRRTSFYSLWSYISRTIRKYDCMPFLECNRNAAMYRDGVIVLDLSVAEGLCRRLELDSISAYERLELLGRLRQVYRGPLLPGVKHKEVELARAIWERKVVDAILSSVSALDLPGAAAVIEDHLSFAFSIDPTRQDLAYALMRAQRLLGRHAEATETFVRCQKESLERHGIGANARLKDLYQDVLADVS
ncbi:MAG: BTAD domain-containing putative transcriptional regulator [Coriobacteriia bacterium]|nr:BTAD domain-containing putative transcriptional regulator [Coriobacteriia bacterium]